MMADKKNMDSHDGHPEEGSLAWLCHEFWPILLFGGCFLAMCTIPLIASGFLTMHALAIIAASTGALVILFTPFKKLIGHYIFLVALTGYIISPDSWGSMGIIFMVFILLGTFFIPEKNSSK